MGMTIQLAQVECLACGYRRAIRLDDRSAGRDECPRCRYVGWAESSKLTEPMRRLLRERPPARRRLRAV